MSWMARRFAWLVAAVAATIAAAVAGPAPRAWGHGDVPEPVEVLTRAAATNEIVLATNFGVMISRAGGGTWEWIL